MFLSLKVLQGNTYKVRTAGLILDPPIIARFIKINVKTYEARPALRVELYGCTDGVFILLLSLYIFLGRVLHKRRCGYNCNLLYVRVLIKTITEAYLFDRIYARLLFISKIHYYHLLIFL